MWGSVLRGRRASGSGALAIVFATVSSIVAAAPPCACVNCITRNNAEDRQARGVRRCLHCQRRSRKLVSLEKFLPPPDGPGVLFFLLFAGTTRCCVSEAIRPVSRTLPHFDSPSSRAFSGRLPGDRLLFPRRLAVMAVVPKSGLILSAF